MEKQTIYNFIGLRLKKNNSNLIINDAPPEKEMSLLLKIVVHGSIIVGMLNFLKQRHIYNNPSPKHPAHKIICNKWNFIIGRSETRMEV